jgi:hypothetical protein
MGYPKRARMTYCTHTALTPRRSNPSIPPHQPRGPAMNTEKEPKGLAFIKQIIRLICDEYGHDHAWMGGGDVFTAAIHRGSNKFKVVFDRDSLSDPESDNYQTMVQALMTKLLRECRAARDGHRPTWTPATPAHEIH